MFGEFLIFANRNDRRRGSVRAQSCVSFAEVWNNIQLERRILMAVAFPHDSNRIAAISIDGINLLTGGGVYLIGSKTGTDDPTSNYSSVGSTGGVMTNGGPAFKLSFWQKSPNVLGFRAEVGPVSTSTNTLSMPFDFAKNLVGSFVFNGSRYYLNGSSSGINYSSGSAVTYGSIPTPYPIYQNGQLLGHAGVADTKAATTWGEVRGSIATVRVNILNSSHYRSMGFFNHFGTNNLELRFGSFKAGEKAMVEGEIIVTQLQSSSSWTFQAESDLAHQIGRRDGDGWSVRVGDTPGRYMSYGPYTTAIKPGNRTATFRLLLDNVTADNNRILTLDIYDANSGKVLASRNLTRRQFNEPWKYQDFDLNFTAKAGQRLEFRTYWHGGSYARQDYVRVR